MTDLADAVRMEQVANRILARVMQGIESPILYIFESSRSSWKVCEEPYIK